MGEGRKHRILVVDDDSGMRDLLSNFLTHGGYDVSTAVDGVDGMTKFRSQRVDLAIVDMFMPEKDGLEMLMEVRRNFEDAKVLVISGGGDLHMGNVLSLAEKLNANAVLAKPFTKEQLLAAVGKLLA